MTKIIVFDIDGTIANMEHRRHWVATKPKNWPAFNAGMSQDTVHEDIASLMDMFADKDYTILLCSGRGEETRSRNRADHRRGDHRIACRSLQHAQGDRGAREQLPHRRR